MHRSITTRRCVVDAVAEIAARHPERPAIVHNGQPMSYADLSSAMWAVAGHLGPDPGTVGLLATYTPATIVGMLGIWASAGTYCPIDPAFPAQRREAMLAAAECRRLLDMAEALPGARPRPTPLPDPDAPAYILFTSGSTGEPKPVVTPRLAIETVVPSLLDLFALSDADRVLQFASLNWDTCFEEILPTLTAGACLVLHDDAHTLSLPRFLRMVTDQGATVLDLPTAFWHGLVHYLTTAQAVLPPSLRTLIIGGEATSPARLAQWSALDTGHIRLVNTYGCTETTLITHAADLHGPLAGAQLESGGPVPIGSPLSHVEQRIGADDELMIGGPCLALGYRGMPDVAARRFITVDGKRFFRTGDRVGVRPDGMLVHRGRLDGEVKIRGIRVNPAETEVHVAEHPSVSAAAVVGVTAADRAVLVAYVVPRPDADRSTLEAELLGHLRARLPIHLIPGRILLVDELAQTSSGKVDREQLRKLPTS